MCLKASGGSVGLCFCPGKVVTRNAVKHERDLHLDLQHLKQQHSITCVLCLLNTAELRVSCSANKATIILLTRVSALYISDESTSVQSFGLRDYEAGIKKAGLRLLSFPIIEMAAPDCIDATHTIIKQTAELLAQGHHIAVHCRLVAYVLLVVQNWNLHSNLARCQSLRILCTGTACPL